MRLCAVIPFLFALCASAAPSLSLWWGPSPDADVNNYRLHWGPGSGNYNGFADLGNVTNTVFTQLVPGARYFFVVTAMNAAGEESPPSNEIDFQIPGGKPGAPTTLHFPITIEASNDLKTWRNVGAAAVPLETPAAFYRLRIEQPAPVVQSAGLKAAAAPALSPVKSPFSKRTMKPRALPPTP